MEADLEQIKAADLNIITPVLIGNTADYSEIRCSKRVMYPSVMRF